MSYFSLMENLIIRDATLVDLSVLLEFEQELIKAEQSFDVTIKNTSISYYDIKSYIKNEEIKVVVAEYNGEVISSGYALKSEASDFLNHNFYAYLGFMYTIKEFRGKGINKKIVEVLKEWCLVNNLNEIRLNVYYENESAIKAYQKTKFKPHMIEMRLDN